MKKNIMILMLISCLGVAQAVERYVSINGTHQEPFTNWIMAATNLKTAVDWANTNNAQDTVWVSNGLYVLSATVNVSNVIVCGVSGQVDNVVVSGNNAVRCFILNHPNAMLDGLTVSNGARAGSSTDSGGGVCIITGSLVNAVIGWSSANWGAGVFCRGQGWMSNCQVLANTSSLPGGGMFLNATGTNTITVQDCWIVGNRSTNVDSGVGGGIGIQGSSLTRMTISQCLIANNSAQVQGGGIGFYDAGCGVVRDCSIVSNESAGTGGGVSGTRHVAILDCLFQANTSSGHGGGMNYNGYSGGYTGHIFGCTVENNLGGTGGVGAGGVYFSGEGGVSNSLLVSNRGTHGAGAWLQNGAVMRSCLIADNSQRLSNRFGGGLYLQNTSTVENCTIVGNLADTGGGIRMATTNAQMLLNCIVYDNWTTNIRQDLSLDTGGTNFFFNCCAGTMVLPPAQGNITNNPLFIATNDYRLQSGSPCINTGTNLDWMTDAFDLDGRLRQDRFSRKVDMGAYEFVPEGMLFMSK